MGRLYRLVKSIEKSDWPVSAEKARYQPIRKL